MIPIIFLKNSQIKLHSRKKNPTIFISEKYMKGYFALSRFLAGDILPFNVLFWSSITNFKTQDPGFRVLSSGPELWVQCPKVPGCHHKGLLNSFISKHFKMNLNLRTKNWTVLKWVRSYFLKAKYFITFYLIQYYKNACHDELFFLFIPIYKWSYISRV